jgi:hypothetical protein
MSISNTKLPKRQPDGSLEGLTDIDSVADRAWALEINSWKRRKHTVPSTAESFGSATTSQRAHQLVRLLFGTDWFAKGYRVQLRGSTYHIVKAQESIK